VDRAKESQIPMKFWSRLQKGETIEEEGMVYTPDMVLGEQRKGIKVTYCTDTRPVPVIAEEAKGADLFICEGMYGDGVESRGKETYDICGSGRTGQSGRAGADVADPFFTIVDPAGFLYGGTKKNL